MPTGGCKVFRQTRPLIVVTHAQIISRAIYQRQCANGWCASRAAAILYGKEPGSGLGLAERQGFVTQRSVYGVLSWRAICVGLTRFAGAVLHRQRWSRDRKCGTIEEPSRHCARNWIVRQSPSTILVDGLTQPKVAAHAQRCLQLFDSAADLKQTKPVLAKPVPYPHWLCLPHLVSHLSTGRQRPTFTTIAPGINSTASFSVSPGDGLG
jgi:hypothetical protein